jgi:hypothetical protein
MRGNQLPANTGLQKLAVDCERDNLRGRAGQGDLCVLRVSLLVIAISMLFGASAVLATFFTGQPFTAASPSGAKSKMTFTLDGKMTREPLEQSGNASAGTWKLSAKGFCTAWGHARASCFTIIPSGENKWSVQKIATAIATTVAIWSK